VDGTGCARGGEPQKVDSVGGTGRNVRHTARAHNSSVATARDARAAAARRDGTGLAARTRDGRGGADAGGAQGQAKQAQVLRLVCGRVGSGIETGRNTAAGGRSHENREHDARAQPLDPRAGYYKSVHGGFRSARRDLEVHAGRGIRSGCKGF
jgi:hypothetical protein